MSLWNMIFGSLATLIGAVGTYLLRKKQIYLDRSTDPREYADRAGRITIRVRGRANVLAAYAYTVAVGEILSAGFFGLLPHRTLKSTKLFNK